jgi:hypothetical protein
MVKPTLMVQKNVPNPVMDVNDFIFGTVSLPYCFWFYLFSLFGFIGLVISLASFLLSLLFVNFGKYLWQFTLLKINIIFAMFSIYFSNRLLYNMCLRTEM